MLSSSVAINDVQVALSSVGGSYNPNGSFSLGLGTQLGASSTFIGSGTLVFNPNGNPTSQLFDFSNLDITLGPGTYYLDFSGANAEIDYSQPLLSSYGTLGTQFGCDPTVQACGISNSWDTETNKFGPYAVDLNGTVVPSDTGELNETAFTLERSRPEWACRYTRAFHSHPLRNRHPRSRRRRPPQVPSKVIHLMPSSSASSTWNSSARPSPSKGQHPSQKTAAARAAGAGIGHLFQKSRNQKSRNAKRHGNRLLMGLSSLCSLFLCSIALRERHAAAAIRRMR